MLWDDLQMKEKWEYEAFIRQAMTLKRMYYTRMHRLLREVGDTRLSFYGYCIPKTVWTNQINIIRFYMRAMATLFKLFGLFISIEQCGEMMAPLFTEGQDESLNRLASSCPTAAHGGACMSALTFNCIDSGLPHW